MAKTFRKRMMLETAILTLIARTAMIDGKKIYINNTIVFRRSRDRANTVSMETTISIIINILKFNELL